MTRYTLFNLALLGVFLPICFVLLRGRTRQLWKAARVSLAIVLLAYPWDFFAIHFRAWSYPLDPGPLLLTVPVNDLAFIFACSMLATSVYIRFGALEGESHRGPEAKDARQ